MTPRPNALEVGRPHEIKASYDRDELLTLDGLFHYHPELQDKVLTAQLAVRAKQLQAILDETRPKHAAITGQQTFTAEEKMEKITELMADMADRVKRDVVDLLGVDVFRKFTAAQRELRSADRTLEMPLEFKHEQTVDMEREIRDEIRKLPELERRSLLFEAVNDDDRLTLRAFRFCPPRFPLCSQADLEEALDLHSRRRFLEAWEQCDAMGTLWSLCRQNFEQFCRIMVDLAGRGGDAIMKELRVENFLPEDVTTEPNPFLDPALARPVS